VVTRGAFKVMPTPEFVIAHMNALATRDNGEAIAAVDFSVDSQSVPSPMMSMQGWISTYSSR
jgi:hypothetical protein